jgi:hypothetical protein
MRVTPRRVGHPFKHQAEQASRSPSFGIARLFMFTCGQSEPHIIRSGACLTKMRAIGVTEG